MGEELAQPNPGWATTRLGSDLHLFVSADIEPEITGQRKESLHEMAVHLDGVLRGVRFHPAVPVGFVSGIGQLPQCSGYGSRTCSRRLSCSPNSTPSSMPGPELISHSDSARRPVDRRPTRSPASPARVSSSPSFRVTASAVSRASSPRRRKEALVRTRLVCVRRVVAASGQEQLRPALSAWESDQLRLPYCLTCAARCPPLAVRDRWSPGLMTLLCLSIRFW